MSDYPDIEPDEALTTGNRLFNEELGTSDKAAR
jgi:hypothetical protein